MSFQSDKLQLINEFDVLKQQASQTNEAWNDPVQRRFYEQFIDSLPKEFLNYIDELDKLDKAFNNAEEKINGILRY